MQAKTNRKDEVKRLSTGNISKVTTQNTPEVMSNPPLFYFSKCAGINFSDAHGLDTSIT